MYFYTYSYNFTQYIYAILKLNYKELRLKNIICKITSQVQMCVEMFIYYLRWKYFCYSTNNTSDNLIYVYFCLLRVLLKSSLFSRTMKKKKKNIPNLIEVNCHCPSQKIVNYYFIIKIQHNFIEWNWNISSILI